MVAQSNPYDELPYKSLPIEWTAPERLALTSLLHGGPRQLLNAYTVLELGCGNGTNLLPLAYYRRHATFVSLDGAGSQIDVANARKSTLQLSNVSFVAADFADAAEQLSGEFDFIIAHGVFSWVPDDVRDALLELCAQRLRPGGLLYLNYNSRPGWNVRGLVRDFLLAQTAGTTGLLTRAQEAQDYSARVASFLTADEHPYTQLIINEFRFVCDKDISFIAHEYLAAHNQPYWRSEFLDLMQDHGLDHVADADFNYSSGRSPEDLELWLREQKLTGRTLNDTVDLLCYRQMHSPILTRGPLSRSSPSLEEFANLLVASCLTPCTQNGGGNSMLQHPSGYQVEVKQEVVRAALTKLRTLWSRGLPIGATFPDVSRVMDELMFLQRNGLIELRCIEPGDFGVRGGPLNRLEAQDGYITTPYHTCEAVSE